MNGNSVIAYGNNNNAKLGFGDKSFICEYLSVEEWRNKNIQEFFVGSVEQNYLLITELCNKTIKNFIQVFAFGWPAIIGIKSMDGD